jgi:curli biogenesis system outer membrane secretion channel CsgG
MKRMPGTIPWSAAVLALLFALPAPSFAQGKIKVAIWEFENHADSYWYSSRLGPAARDQIDTEFSENQMLSSKFSVIERDKLALVLKEQGLATSGAVDPTTAAKVGKLLGVKYIILGGIDKFAINNTKGGIGALGVGGNLVQANATINLRFIDTTTAERIVSISSDGEVKKGGGFLNGTSLSRDNEWGIASETVQKTAKAIVTKLTTGDYLARVSSAATPGALEGKVVKVDGNRAYINLGASSGIKMGDTFNIINVGEALIDPDSGKRLGADEKQIGSGSVTEVQAEFAIITFTGKAAAKDTIRKK